MAKTTIKIDPVSRISGLLSVNVVIDNGVIVDAQSGGMQVRGFEHMLKGRPPLDTIRLTARTCGICSCAHTVASSMALEMALGVKPDFNGQLIRNLAHGFETLQNTIRQIYNFVLPDYVDISGISPLYKTVSPRQADYRLPKEINTELASHYALSIEHSRNAHKAEAILAGKAPHNHGVFVGGITTDFDIDKFNQVKAILYTIKEFIAKYMVPDLRILMRYYPEYNDMGTGIGNYLSYGYYADMPKELMVAKSGVLVQGTLSELDPRKIKEDLKYTWVNSPNNVFKPTENPPLLDYKKEGAYSWVDAPRYDGKAFETGCLANMLVNGTYKGGTGVLHRIMARCMESVMICDKMEEMLTYTRFQPAFQEPWKIPDKGEGFALVGAARGGLLHWLTIENKVIQNYTLLPPSSWNMSPMDNNNVHGGVEQGLIGTRIDDMSKAEVTIGRIVRSFDPCLNCAAHIVSDKQAPFAFQII